MQLRYARTIREAVEGETDELNGKICDLSWAPNGQRLVAVTAERQVVVFDAAGVQRDRFQLKPAAKGGPRDFVVRGVEFGPDSARLAVAQTDGVVYVYQLGTAADDRKSVCNKFAAGKSGAPCTALCWPGRRPDEVVFGTGDGKVRVGLLRTNKTANLYEDEAGVVALCAGPDGHSVASAHADGALFRYTFPDAARPAAKSALGRVGFAPYVLAWGATGALIAAGADSGTVLFLAAASGDVLARFKLDEQREVSAAAFSPSGKVAVVGSWDGFTVFSCDERWTRVGTTRVPGLGAVTALRWRPDGSLLTTGAMTGAVDMYDACLKRYLLRNRFQVTFTSPASIVVADNAASRSVSVGSRLGLEIQTVDIVQDRFVVARTASSFLVANLVTGKTSEIRYGSTVRPRLMFPSPDLALVYSAGELSAVELGTDDVIGSCRTEFMTQALVSVSATRSIAYLLDRQTAVVLDLRSGVTQATVAHDSDLDWLEMNAGGGLLLFRDARRALHLYAVADQRRVTLAPFVSYAQWVPQTDVAVAQTRSSLLVWYNVATDAAAAQPTVMALPPRAADVTQIERGGGRTRVVFDDDSTVDLDETQISFVAALESGQYEPVVLALERLGDAADESMWTRLSQLALDDGNLFVAERCFVALGDVARAEYVRETIEMGDPGSDTVRARLALLAGNFRLAEALQLGAGRVDDAINMYVRLQKWDQAIAIAESRGHDDLPALRQRHLAALLASGQEVRAGELRELDGDYVGAVRLYLRGGAGPRAADLIRNQGLSQDAALVEEVVQSLLQRGQYEPAGDFLRQLAQTDRALQAYRDGRAYARAVDLCRQSMPARVTQIETEWGDWLAAQGQHDAASNHYIEGGAYTKAIAAAIDAGQYSKAGQILAQVDTATARPFYRRIAQLVADSAGGVRDAEPYYVAGGLAADAVDRYLAEGALDDAERLAAAHLSRPETVTLFAAHAQRLQSQGMLAQAERLLLAMDQVDRAIDMYRQAGNADAVIRLVSRFRKDQIAETYATMAKQALRDGKLAEAESYLVKIGKWRDVVELYKQRGAWTEAMRVARSADEPGAYEAVACAYARTLSADAAAKFLKDKSLVERAVDVAMERADFQEAFRIADKAGARTKLLEVHLQYAMALEDEGQFAAAEAEFLAAQKPREAIDMYLHQHDWTKATQIAQQHDPAALPNVYTAQGAFAEQNRDLAAAESLYLNAGRPELAIQMYRNAKAWTEALRCARTFRPNLVAEIQTQSAASASIEARAAQMVQSGQASAAIDLLLSVTGAAPDHLEKTWLDAVKLAVQHVPNRVRDIVVVVAQRLVSIGRHTNAADLLAGADLVRDAVDVLVNAGDFRAAASLAAARAPEMVEVVERAEHGGASPIDALAAQGQWPRVYELAKAKGQLDRYQVAHLRSLLSSQAIGDAVAVVVEHGVPASSDGVAMVVQVARVAIADALKRPAGGRSTVDAVKRMLSAPGVQHNAELVRLQFVSHLVSVQNRAENAGLKRIVAKVAISLVRYPADVPVDRALYEAGRACQAVDWGNMAFVFFNRFVDVCDLIDDPDHGDIDNSDFMETDIPPPSSNILPKTLSYSDEEREEIREMVLEIAMSNATSQSLTQRQCETCSARTYAAGLTCHQCRKTAPACCITGYPVLETTKVECGACHHLANRDDWNRFVTKLKMCAWCATPATPFY